MAAREGEQTWNALYHEVNATPPAASLSSAGVWMLPLSPASAQTGEAGTHWSKHRVSGVEGLWAQRSGRF